MTDPLLATAMVAAGHGWTTGFAPAFDLPTLLSFDGIFLAGDGVDNHILIDYVLAGGNVYLAGGTGVGGAVAEAARWNVFLNHFGLSFFPGYNGISGSLPIDSPHPIFAGVDSLYQFNGNSVQSFGPDSQVLVRFQGEGLFAIYSPSDPENPAPEPGTLLMVLAGVVIAASFVRRSRRRPSQE